jgi:ubiquitin carboxyl-terminal hydrolase 8
MFIKMDYKYDYDFHTNHEIILPMSKYKGKGLCGLINLGNKCFLNSILACLSNTVKLTDYFLSCKYKKDDPEQLNKRKKEYNLVSSYLHLLINIWETNQIIKPKTFIENISKFVNKYYTLEQQDSHECLLYILDILHKGLLYEIEVNIQGVVQNEQDILMKKSIEQWKFFYEKNYSFIIESFNGMFYNNVVCNSCNIKENIFEPYNTISLTIPESGSFSLNECLFNYFNKVEKIDTWNCDKCKNYGCKKENKIWSFPNYVIIHFNRFKNNGSKINTNIDFPIDNLNLTEHISKDKKDPNNYIYSLYAINYHSGNSRSGHYFSCCKNLNKNWYLFNDGDVSKIENSNTLQSIDVGISSKDAYILFYHRKFIK